MNYVGAASRLDFHGYCGRTYRSKAGYENRLVLTFVCKRLIIFMTGVVVVIAASGVYSIRVYVVVRAHRGYWLLYVQPPVTA